MSVILFLSDTAMTTLCDRAEIPWDARRPSRAKGIGKLVAELSTHTFKDARSSKDDPWWDFDPRYGRTIGVKPYVIELLAAHAIALGLCYGMKNRCLMGQCDCAKRTNNSLASLLLESLGCGRLTSSRVRMGAAALLV